jgi:hypothetical protein
MFTHGTSASTPQSTIVCGSFMLSSIIMILKKKSEKNMNKCVRSIVTKNLKLCVCLFTCHLIFITQLST